MSTTTGSAISLAIRLLLAGCILVATISLVVRRPAGFAGGDQSRYATVALNLADHGVFSAHTYDPARRPPPGLAWAGPIIAIELGVLARFHRPTHAALACIAARTGGCDTALPALRLAHIAEVLILLAAVGWIGRLVLDSERLGWIAAALALTFRETLEFTNLVLAEPLFLAVYGVLAALLAGGLASRRGIGWWAAAGFAAGLAILVKPSVLLAAPLVPTWLLARRWWADGDGDGDEGGNGAYGAAAAFSLAAGAVVGLWIVRGWLVLGTPAMTDPTYLEASLAHRFGYHRMSWSQWLAGWIYYLPDFGDDLASRLFGRDWLAGLGWGPRSFYEYGFGPLHQQARAHAAPAIATRHLIETHVLGEPLKFIGVTLLLAWRGLFVGRTLGLAGLFALPFALLGLAPRQREVLAALTVFALGLALVHAAVSVSIPRYNLALIPVFSIALAWAIGHIALRVASSPRR